MITEYLTVSNVERIAQLAVGGAATVRNRSVLESAVGQPTMTMFGEDLYADLASKAAALWYSIDHNQPFMDGNKRTAILAAATFLELNDHRLALNDMDLYELAMQVATGTVKDIDELSRILRAAVTSL